MKFVQHLIDGGHKEVVYHHIDLGKTYTGSR